MPVFEQRIDNIVGISYAMDLLDYLQKACHFYYFVLNFYITKLCSICILLMHLTLNILQGEVLETTSVGDIAHKPAYFVPGMILLPQVTSSYVFSCRNWLACIIDTYLCLLLGIYSD